MRRGQSDQERDVNRIQRFSCLAPLQFLGDSEERQDIEPLVFGFVAQIRNALFCQRIVAPVPADIVRFESLQPFGRNQAGGEKRVRGLDRFIAVIDRDNHGLEPPHFV